MPEYVRTLLLPFLLVGCANSDPDISTQITAQFDASPSAPIDLRQVAGPDWERVCVLGPYTDNEHTEKALGLKWNSEQNSSIGINDGITTLVFIRGKEVVAFTEHARNKGDFVGMQPPCVKRALAVFDRQSRNSWVLLTVQH